MPTRKPTGRPTGRPKGKKKLTAKQERFVREYLATNDAAKAARRAGYETNNPAGIGHQVLQGPMVKAVVAKEHAKLAEKLQISAERVLTEYARIAFADTGRVMEWGPGGVKLVESSELSEDDRRAVAEVQETTSRDGGSMKLKLHDKKGALDSLAKHLGLFIERHELTGKDGAPLITNVTVKLVKPQ